MTDIPNPLEAMEKLTPTEPAKTVLVTGALGHFGKELVARLLREKLDWMVLASDFKPPPMNPVDVWGSDAPGRVQFVQVDLADSLTADAVEVLVSKAHYILHLGAYPGPAQHPPPGTIVRQDPMAAFEEHIDMWPPREGEEANYAWIGDVKPRDLLRSNTVGSQVVFEAAIKHRCRRVVFTSTAFGYGWTHDPRDFAPKYFPIDEEHGLFPTEHYGLSKQVGEQQIEMLQRAGAVGGRMLEPWEEGGGPSFAIFRFPNSIWRGEWHQLPWPKPSKTCCFGGPIMWAYVHDDDVIEGILKGMEMPEKDLGPNKWDVFNLAAPDCRLDMPIMELIERFWQMLNKPPPEIRKPLGRYGSILSNEKATRALGINFKTRRVHKTFAVPSGFKLQNGEVLDDSAFVVYETYGTLNDSKSNALLCTACYAQRHYALEKFIGPGKRFDTSKYFVIALNLLGNGLSYSPTTPDTGNKYPRCTVTYHDNVKLQKMIVSDLGIKRLALIYGFSMGAMTAFEWAVQFPEMVAGVVAVAGSPKTGDANTKFIKTLHSDLKSDPTIVLAGDRIASFKTYPKQGLTKFGHTYVDWMFSPGFWTNKLYQQFGFPPEMSEEMVRDTMVSSFWLTNWDAMEYYVVSDTWLSGDVSNNDTFKGDLKKALGSITAKVYVMPGKTDQYFQSEEIALQTQDIPNLVFQPIDSDFGHVVDDRPECQSAINEAIQRCLAETA